MEKLADTFRIILVISGLPKRPHRHDLKRARVTEARKKSILLLPLGGAAVHRCDKFHVSNVGFSRLGSF